MLEEERLMILQMVEEGKITAAEAAELLAALEEHARTEAKVEEIEIQEETRGRVDDRFGSFETRFEKMGEDIERAATKFGETIEQRISENVERIPSFVEKLLDSLNLSGFQGFMGPGYEFKEEMTGEFDAGPGDTVELDFQTRNGRVEVEGWDQPGYRVVLKKKVRANSEEEAAKLAEQMVKVEKTAHGLTIQTNNDVSLVQGGVQITVMVPKKHTYRPKLQSSNGRVTVETLDLGSAELKTSNGRIECINVTAKDVVAHTSNGRIVLDGVSGSVSARTSNGRIHVSTSGIKEDAEFVLSTSNGSVRIDPDTTGSAGYEVSAHTSLGKIRLGLLNLVFEEDTRERRGNKTVHARTEGYENAAIKVKIQATTSNGSINIGVND